ncbi:MAG: porin [bacterium]
MNKKLIAAAVSAAVVAPVASYADVAVYGNITNAINISDDGTESKTELSTQSSRVGIKASSDLGNGMTANGRYEWATKTDNASDPFSSTRLAQVGLSGAFGTVTLGQQWSSFYNTIGSFVSPNYVVNVGSGGFVNGDSGSGRTGNTIKYANSFGPVSLALDIRVDDDGDDGADYESGAGGQGFGIGLTFNPIDNLSVGVAYDNTDGASTGTRAVAESAIGADDGVAGTHDEGDNTVMGIAGKMNFGGFWVSAGYQEREIDGASAITATGAPTEDAREAIESDHYQLWVGGSLGDNTSWNLGYGEESTEEGATETDIERVALAFNYKLGGGTHFFLEYMDSTTEETNEKDVDSDTTVAGIRINF